jgi:prevent-host-death family protein
MGPTGGRWASGPVREPGALTRARFTRKATSVSDWLRSTRATLRGVSRRITQRELRNQSGDIMRALDRGESFVVTRNGTPVGELVPTRPRQFVSTHAVASAFAGSPPIDPVRFRDDVDALVDEDPTPRA